MTELPAEFEGVPAGKIKENIKRLEQAMEAELETIRSRYMEKISYMQSAY
jgi:hypothetical protein